MKKFFSLILMATALISCGVANQSSTAGKSIPTTFFHCTFGGKQYMVSKTMSRQGFYQDWYYNSYKALAPLGKRKIKSIDTYQRISYGGYTWNNVSFLYDYRDRFFCIAFSQEFANEDAAVARYKEIKNTLDEKYGSSQKTQHGVLYGNPQGKCIQLALNGTFCILYYLDEKIYQASTVAAINEL